MANRRMTSSDLFEDDFINSLDFFQRYLWIGLFVACADDQGRFMDSHPIIRAKVFPFDREVTDDFIEAALVNFCNAGKIVRYVANGKRLVQIVKWWSYQTPSWASPSKYPAPVGWTDRFKYHTVGNKIHVENWKEQGGYMLHSELPNGLHSQQDSAIDESEGESDVNGEDESEGDDEINKQEPVVVSEKPKDKIPLKAQAASMLTARMVSQSTLKELLEAYRPDMLIDYCHAYDQAVDDGKANNPGWLVTALKQQYNIKNLLKKRDDVLLQSNPARYVVGKYSELVEH